MKLLIFIVATVVITFYSLPSFHNRSHGVPRFFAFEFILLLVLVNADAWFSEPFSPPQIFSWFLLLASLLLAIHGFYLLHIIGKPQGSFEDTTKLVVIGAYKYIRHPLYCSLLLLALGAFLKDVSLLGSGLAIAAIAFLSATAIVEERENVKKFGTEYVQYMEKTARFIPFLY